MSFGLVLDVVLVALLAAALVYMAQLNRRLDALRAGRAELEALVKRFTESTQQAQSTIDSMKAAAASTGKGLQEEIDKARGLREDLAFLAERANGLADQLELAIARARPQAAPATVTRMPVRGEEQPSAPATRGATKAAPTAGPAPLSSGENELLRRLSTLR